MGKGKGAAVFALVPGDVEETIEALRRLGVITGGALEAEDAFESRGGRLGFATVMVDAGHEAPGDPLLVAAAQTLGPGEHLVAVPESMVSPRRRRTGPWVFRFLEDLLTAFGRGFVLLGREEIRALPYGVVAAGGERQTDQQGGDRVREAAPRRSGHRRSFPGS